MSICAGAYSVCVELQQSKSSHHRAILYVTGDALRVVDEISKVCQFSNFNSCMAVYSRATFSSYNIFACGQGIEFVKF